MESRGVDPTMGPKLEPILRECGVFNEVHAHKIEVPLSGKAHDATLGVLGQVIKLSYYRAFKDFDTKLIAYGLTKQVQNDWYLEFANPSQNSHAETYLTWVQKQE